MAAIGLSCLVGCRAAESVPPRSDPPVEGQDAGAFADARLQAIKECFAKNVKVGDSLQDALGNEELRGLIQADHLADFSVSSTGPILAYTDPDRTDVSTFALTTRSLSEDRSAWKKGALFFAFTPPLPEKLLIVGFADGSLAKHTIIAHSALPEAVVEPPPVAVPPASADPAR